MADWVSLLEGARMIARHLKGTPGDAFSQEVKVAAAGKLLGALRAGAVASEGWRDQGSMREPLTVADWTTLKAEIDQDRLVPRAPTLRRIVPERIVEIVVDADNVRRIIAEHAASVEASGPAAEPPELNASGQAPQPRKIASEDQVTKILKALRERVGSNPTEREDLQEVKRDWPNTPRQRVREIRQVLAPIGGYKSGPKGPRNPAADI